MGKEREISNEGSEGRSKKRDERSGKVNLHYKILDLTLIGPISQQPMAIGNHFFPVTGWLTVTVIWVLKNGHSCRSS